MFAICLDVAHLTVYGDAPDRYRVFGIVNSKNHDTTWYWLSGNRKSQGTDCFVDLPFAASLVEGPIHIREWGQIPSNSCS